MARRYTGGCFSEYPRGCAIPASRCICAHVISEEGTAKRLAALFRLLPMCRREHAVAGKSCRDLQLQFGGRGEDQGTKALAFSMPALCELPSVCKPRKGTHPHTYTIHFSRPFRCESVAVMHAT